MDYHGSTAPSDRKNHQEVKYWYAKLQGKKGNCLPEGFVFELPSAVYPKFPETKKIKELKAIWESWTVDRQYAFTAKYAPAPDRDRQTATQGHCFVLGPVLSVFHFQSGESDPNRGGICCFA